MKIDLKANAIVSEKQQEKIEAFYKVLSELPKELILSVSIGKDENNKDSFLAVSLEHVIIEAVRDHFRKKMDFTVKIDNVGRKTEKDDTFYFKSSSQPTYSI